MYFIILNYFQDFLTLSKGGKGNKNKENNNIFYEIPNKVKYNPFIIKMFLKFVYEYLVYIKTNKVIIFLLNDRNFY